MAKAYLLCHGSEDPGAKKTFVPAGRSISFYADIATNVLRSNGLAAVSAGDLGPSQTYGPGEEVPNYQHFAFDDREMAEHLASESSRTDGALYFVGSGALAGNPILLCSTPDVCVAPTHGPGCKGVFAGIKESDIFSVACRGRDGHDDGSDFKLEGTTEHIDELGTEAQRILDWAGTDPRAALDYYRSLSQATQVALDGANRYLKEWVHANASDDPGPAALSDARAVVADRGDRFFADYVDGMEAKQKSMVLAEDDLLNAYWLGYGRRMIQDQGAPAFSKFFFESDQWAQDLMGQDQELYNALAMGSQGGGVAESSTWTASGEELAYLAQSVNAPYAKELSKDAEGTWRVGGFALILGDGGGDLVSRVAQQPDHASGTFYVERATFGAGSMVFTGVPPVHQGTVEARVAEFSQKDVRFE